MLQYKIPADVQIEDKILGPLTLKQLIICAAGAGISYMIFLFMSDLFFLGLFDYIIIAIPFFLSTAFAFLRINDVSFLKWILLLAEHMHNSRRRHWDKRPTVRLHYQFVTAKIGSTTTKESEDKKKAKAAKADASKPGRKQFSSLEEITHLLDHSSQFKDEEKNVPDEHEDDFALHLSAPEKDRHEVRISQAMSSFSPQLPNNPRTPGTSLLEQLRSPAPISKPVDTINPSVNP